MDQIKILYTITCGNTQLCAGSKAGIKGTLHAVQAIWPQFTGWMLDSGAEVEAISEAWSAEDLAAQEND